MFTRHPVWPKLQLNHMAAAPSNHSRLILALSLLLLIGVALGIDQVQSALQQSTQQLQTLEAKSQLRTQPVAVKVVQTAIPAEITLALATPWEALWAALENIPRKHVQIISVQADVKQQKVRILAQTISSTPADSMAQMLAFVSQLKQQALFSQVYLPSHEPVSDAQGGALRFTLEAIWQGV
jgi:uncharacterized membrane protein YjgN (DUF898 family)